MYSVRRTLTALMVVRFVQQVGTNFVAFFLFI